MMISSGRVCVKIAGREAGNVCVVLSAEKGKALIEGMVKKRECSLKHLEPLPKMVKVTKSSTKKEVLDLLVGLNLVSKEEAEKFANKKPSEVKEKPVHKRKEKPKKEAKKKAVKKEVVKAEEKKEEVKEEKKAPAKKKAAPKKKAEK